MTAEPGGLPADRLRADIAQLLDVAPQEIADDDDLTDHGLDSVRMMSLANEWNLGERGLSFAQLVAEPTIAAWAAALAVHPGGGSAGTTAKR